MQCSHAILQTRVGASMFCRRTRLRWRPRLPTLTMRREIPRTAHTVHPVVSEWHALQYALIACRCRGWKVRQFSLLLKLPPPCIMEACLLLISQSYRRRASFMLSRTGASSATTTDAVQYQGRSSGDSLHVMRADICTYMHRSSRLDIIALAQHQ